MIISAYKHFFIRLVFFLFLVMTSHAGSCVIATTGSETSQQRRHGIFASELSLEPHKCGHSNSPWIFRLAPSQTLSLTLRDFTSPSQMTSQSRTKRERCDVYVIIKSINHKTDTLCSRGAEEVSQAGAGAGALQQFNVTHPEVEVRLLPGSDEKRRHFLLEYTSAYLRFLLHLDFFTFMT